MSRQVVSENPKLMLQWDFEKNKGLDPSQITGGSEKKAWWKCGHGHSWIARISSRYVSGCPYCTGKKAWPGFNDIPTTHPHIADEWDYEKNSGLKPEDFTAASNKKVWWNCRRGHSWLAMINKRKCGRGCPYCAGRKLLVGFNDLVTTHSLIAVQWDYNKNDDARPEQFMAGSNTRAWWKCKRGHSWSAIINSRKANGCPYCAGKAVAIGENDLQTVNPAIASEWDYTKNKCIPDKFTANSGYKAWWICSRGHSWQTTIDKRNSGSGCPYCSNHFVLKGFNDLLSQDSKLASEWDSNKNSPLLPDAVTCNSAKKVWWRCKHGHSWKSEVVTRRKGSGCPACAGKAAAPGENDLKTLRPETALEWDYAKNGELTPENVTSQSSKLVWWVCSRGHSYKSRVYNRYNGNGCPYCCGRLPIVGETDLATMCPELVSEWDYERNSSKRPQDFTALSNKKVWWRCEKGHSWKGTICNRNNGCGCPYCAGKVAISGENDAATIYPELTLEWDSERNGQLSLNQLLPNSLKKGWWICKNGHHWRATVHSRMTGTGCPYCNGKTPMQTRLVK